MFLPLGFTGQLIQSTTEMLGWETLQCYPPHLRVKTVSISSSPLSNLLFIFFPSGQDLVTFTIITRGYRTVVEFAWSMVLLVLFLNLILGRRDSDAGFMQCWLPLNFVSSKGLLRKKSSCSKEFNLWPWDHLRKVGLNYSKEMGRVKIS